MNKQTITDVDVSGKKVFVRCDFNVPQDKNGKITDDKRIRAALPTIKYLSEHGAKVILCSHLGRPKGTFDPKYSLLPVAQRLSELLQKEIPLAADVIGEDAIKHANALKNGDIMLLENVRFHAEEEKNDPEFAKKLSNFADIYVNDAFGTAHRAHASTAGIAQFCKHNVSGFLIEKELKVIGGALENPQRPFVAILGGAKVSDKIGVIENLIKKVDALIIGGAMAFTFIAAKGVKVGNSKVEEDKLELARELMKKAEKANVKIYFPCDVVAAKEFSADAEAKEFDIDKIPDGYMGLDIGKKTVVEFGNVIANAKTLIWNGPIGVFEFEKFANGTKAVAKAMADNSEAVTIIGGGDSAAAVEQMGFSDKLTHISTGGGASLEYIEGKLLPGIECLDNK